MNISKKHIERIGLALFVAFIFVGSFTFSIAVMHVQAGIVAVQKDIATPISRKIFSFTSTNPDQVKVSGDLFAAVGEGNVVGGTAPYTSTTLFYRFHDDRIRQDGCITKIDLGFAAKPSQVTGFYFQIWRKTEGINNWNKVGTSNDLWPSVTAGTVNTLTFSSPLCGVKEGDHMALYYTLNGTNPGSFLHQDGQHGFNVGYNTVPNASGFDFTTFPDGGSEPQINVYMRAPMFVAIGDSNTAGQPGHASFQEFLGTDDKVWLPFSYKVGKKIGFTGQNAGISGDRVPTILPRYVQDVINIKPKFVLSMIGTNDVRFGVTLTDYIAGYKTMLDAYVANNIMPVVLSIPPCSSSQCDNATLTQMDNYNTALRALVATYPTAKWVDTRPSLGQFRPGGPVGNYWDMKPQYSADNLHYNDAGHTIIANVIYQALTAPLR